jgi:hypothetical protein
MIEIDLLDLRNVCGGKIFRLQSLETRNQKLFPPTHDPSGWAGITLERIAVKFVEPVIAKVQDVYLGKAIERSSFDSGQTIASQDYPL